MSLVIPNKFEVFYQNMENLKFLVAQLEKDIPDLESAFSTELESIYEVLVTYFSKEDLESFLPQLLYKIDVSERGLHEKMSLGHYPSFSELVAESVLVREMEKVFYRITYS